MADSPEYTPAQRIERLEQLVQLLQAQAAAAQSQSLASARNVVTVALPAYTYTAGVITGNAVGAMGAQDGVTNVAGDVVFLPAGIATAAAHQGAYVVERPGDATTTFQLRRVGWMPENAVLNSGFEVRMGGEGATFQNTVWAAMNIAETFTVGTTDSQFFPREVVLRAVLVAGAFTTTAVPILSTSSGVLLTRAVADTTAATVMYAATVGGAEGITPGNLGTASLTVQAVVAAGTINVADVSTLHILIVNGQR